jgi:small subunit ribosomal protein S1
MSNNDEDFAAALEAFERQQSGSRQRDPEIGERIEGSIVSMTDEVAFVDLGGKAEGTVAVDELRGEDGELLYRVGDKVEALVSGSDSSGGWLLRVRPGRGEARVEELRNAHSHGIPVEGRVTGVNKGGAEVEVAGVRAFCPVSQLDLHYVEDPATFVGQRLQFRITRYEEDPRGRRPNVVLSRKALLAEEKRQKAAETRARLEVGGVVRGVVTSVTSYGAFVDLGGLEGLLHVSEMAHGRIDDPAELIAVGQELDVQVNKIELDPKGDGERIALSIRALERDPWLDAAAQFPAGATTRGRITRLANFGAFVELVPGVEGLVHVSEIGGEERIRHPREAVEPDQEVEVRVLAVEPDKRRISLSIAAARAEVEAAEEEKAKADFVEREKTTGFGAMADFFEKAKKKKV